MANPYASDQGTGFLDRRLAWLDALGDQLIFYVKAIGWTPRTVHRYTREIIRLLAEVSFGSGALGVIGGTIGVMVAMTLFTGTVVGLQGYAALNQIGTAAFTGFISAYFNTREIAPLVAGLALSATVGAGFTAQLGAMRISEEVDALEVMGLPSVPYLVTTRILAGARSRSCRSTRSGCSPLTPPPGPSRSSVTASPPARTTTISPSSYPLKTSSGPL